MKRLIQQAYLLPLLFFVPITIGGMLVDGYSWIGQHGSEIGLSDNKVAAFLLNLGAITTGVSCSIFAIEIAQSGRGKYPLSSILLTVWGISLISNGLFKTGSPMHGLYGIGLSLMLLPFVACYEFKGSAISKTFFPSSLLAGFLIFIYFWAYMVGLDPEDYRGLTQRLASVVIFGWIAYFAYEVNRMDQEKSTHDNTIEG